MPRKVTEDRVDQIVHLRDERGYPWSSISEEVGLSEKTCRKHYHLRKREAPGGLHAEAFRLFDRGGKPGDAVRELEIPVEEAKQLYSEYLEMEKEGEVRVEAEPSVSEEFEAFKRRRSLVYTCDKLLVMLDYPFEEPLAGERDLVKERISFLREKVEGERSLDALEKLGELLESERNEIEALLDANKTLCEERREREKEEKREWIIRRRMNQGLSREEAVKSLEEEIDIFEKGLEGVYNSEKELERIERIRDECLKYMSPEDYDRLSMLFLVSLPPAEYLINFWRQEQDILARYGEAGWRELNRLYHVRRESLTRERPELEKEFMRHLWRVGVQPCPRCNILINIIGAPPQFLCPRCGTPLRRQV